jgi:hypothetical protein
MNGTDHIEELGVDGRLILKFILKKQCIRMRTRLISSGQDPVAGSFEHAKESFGSIKCGTFLN